MKVSAMMLISLFSLSALAITPAEKKPAPTDPLFQQSSDLKRGTKIDKQKTHKKKFKAKHSLESDVKEAELLEQKDESSPE